MIARFEDFNDVPDYCSGIPLDVVNGVLSVLEVSPHPRKLSFLNTEFADLPSGSLLGELHAHFYYKHDTKMLPMSSVERGKHAAKLLLQDWVTLGQATENGMFPSLAGFEGFSPLAQPTTLKHLGAKVRPTVLGYRQKEIATNGHKLMTGKTMPNRRSHQFIISSDDLVASIPVAQRYLERLA